MLPKNYYYHTCPNLSILKKSSLPTYPFGLFTVNALLLYCRV